MRDYRLVAWWMVICLVVLADDLRSMNRHAIASGEVKRGEEGRFPRLAADSLEKPLPERSTRIRNLFAFDEVPPSPPPPPARPAAPPPGPTYLELLHQFSRQVRAGIDAVKVPAPQPVSFAEFRLRGILKRNGRLRAILKFRTQTLVVEEGEEVQPGITLAACDFQRSTVTLQARRSRQIHDLIVER